MSCKICGRGACTESFHSLEEQERHEKLADLTPEEAYDLGYEEGRRAGSDDAKEPSK